MNVATAHPEQRLQVPAQPDLFAFLGRSTLLDEALSPVSSLPRKLVGLLHSLQVGLVPSSRLQWSERQAEPVPASL